MTPTLAGAGLQDLDAQLAALLAGSACAVELRDVIRAEGPDTVRFLQGQLAQNIELLEVGSVAWSLLLQPNGRVVGLLRLHRVADDAVLIDVEAGTGETVLLSLRRFLIRTKCTLTLNEAVVGQRWLRSSDVASVPVGEGVRTLSCDPWPGVLLLTETPASVADTDLSVVPPHSSNLSENRTVPAEVFEVFRVLAGEPRAGLDFTDSTLPSETSLIPWTVAFGKGCYTGQELVERIDSRGRMVRSLRRVRTSASVTVGTNLMDEDGNERGVITSAAVLSSGQFAGIALVRDTHATESKPMRLFVDGTPVTVTDLVGDVS